ncbi:MAG TPA: hypothetical protein VNO31_14355 [Umezawaea sp.]|nr:hypothetical protein [Umezawaea sp.]
MSDPTEFPAEFPPFRSLPEGVRDRARQDLAEAMAGPDRPSGRTPLVIAAAVVLLAGVVVGQNSRGGDQVTAGPSDSSASPTYPPSDLAETYHARDGWAPAELVDRCAAVARGLPPRTTWKPIVTTVVHGTTLSAFTTDGTAEVFFCETTRASVTVSAPIAPDTGGAAAAVRFTTANGSTAGVVQPRVRKLKLLDTGKSAITPALVTNGLFLTPQGIHTADQALLLIVDDRQEPAADDLPRPSPSTIDRPQPPGDRRSDAGRRLATCLDTAFQAVPDRANWEPAAHAEVTPTSEVQLGRYGDLLAVCRVRAFGTARSSEVTVVDHADITSKNAHGPQLNGRTVWGQGFYYDRDGVGGGMAIGEDRGYVGLVTDGGVASITLSREGFPDATAVIDNGTFVLTGAATENLDPSPPGVKVTVRDARGDVLDEFFPVG